MFIGSCIINFNLQKQTFLESALSFRYTLIHSFSLNTITFLVMSIKTVNHKQILSNTPHYSFQDTKTDTKKKNIFDCFFVFVFE